MKNAMFLDKCADPLGIGFGGNSKVPDSSFKASSYLKGESLSLGSNLN